MSVLNVNSPLADTALRGTQKKTHGFREGKELLQQYNPFPPALPIDDLRRFQGPGECRVGVEFGGELFDGVGQNAFQGAEGDVGVAGEAGFDEFFKFEFEFSVGSAGVLEPQFCFVGFLFALFGGGFVICRSKPISAFRFSALSFSRSLRHLEKARSLLVW